jgi:hypothetical protein
MVSNVVGSSITIEYGHLDVHEDNVRSWMFRGGRLYQIVQGFLTVPYGVYREAKFLD